MIPGIGMAASMLGGMGGGMGGGGAPISSESGDATSGGAGGGGNTLNMGGKKATGLEASLPIILGGAVLVLAVWIYAKKG